LNWTSRNWPEYQVYNTQVIIIAQDGERQENRSGYNSLLRH